MNKHDGIIFDMDGTIWDTRSAVCNSWNEIFEKEGLSERIDETTLTGLMGLPMNEIAENVLPNIEPAKRKMIFDIAMKNEVSYIRKHGGILYPNLEDTLTELKKHIPLFIVSNCQCGYIEAFFEAHNTADYFMDYECYGNNFLQKDENIKLIVKRNGLQNPVYIGDTHMDEQAATKAGIDFVFAEYGFGIVNNAYCRLGAFSDILGLIL